MPTSLVTRIRLYYLAADLLFGIVIPLAVVNGIEPADATYSLIVLYVFGLGRTAGNMVMVGRIFGPVVRWLDSATLRPDPRELRDVDEMIRRGPMRFTTFASVFWVVQLFASVLVLLFFEPYHAGIAPRALMTTLL